MPRPAVPRLALPCRARPRLDMPQPSVRMAERAEALCATVCGPRPALPCPAGPNPSLPIPTSLGPATTAPIESSREGCPSVLPSAAHALPSHARPGLATPCLARPSPAKAAPIESSRGSRSPQCCHLQPLPCLAQWFPNLGNGSRGCKPQVPGLWPLIGTGLPPNPPLDRGRMGQDPAYFCSALA